MTLFNFRPCKRLLLPCLLLGWHVQLLANDVEQAPQSQPAQGDQEQGWVEQKINPSTEWVENLFYPVIRLMERTVQGQEESPAKSQDTSLSIEGGPVPENALTAEQASHLLTTLHEGQVLKITFQSPNRFQLKHLSHSGRVTTFYMHSQTGVLLEPPANSSIPEEANSDQKNDSSSAELLK